MYTCCISIELLELISHNGYMYFILTDATKLPSKDSISFT